MNIYINYDFVNKEIKNIDILLFLKNKFFFKKIGNNYFSLCPFHIEKNPSFSVNSSINRYYCFGCNKNGNIINFIMEYEKLNYKNSLLYIINYFNLSKESFFKKDVNKINKHLYDINKEISNIFIFNIFHSIYKKYNFIYINNRKIKLDIIKKFNIGLSYKNQIYNRYLHDKDKLNKLNLLGLVNNINNNNKYKDVFNFRVIFPIKNIYGDILGFGGRSIYNIKLKYINSKNNNILKKGNNLYGLYEINKNYKHNIKKILLVEGYMDVLSLYNNDIDYAVSLFGTSITENQIKIIFSNYNEIIFCYDGDLAGRKATFKTLLNILKYITDDKKIIFVFLPNFEDPDSLINKVGKKKFENILHYNSKTFYNYIFEICVKKIEKFDLFGKIKLISLLNIFINKINGKLTKSFLKKDFENRINIFFNKYILIKKYNEKKIFLTKRKNYINVFISLLIQNPYLYIYVYNYINLFYIKNKIFLFIVKICNICKDKDIKDKNKLLYIFKNTKYYNFILKMSNYKNLIDKYNIDNVFNEILYKINNIFINKNLNILISEYKKNKNDDNNKIKIIWNLVKNKYSNK